MESYEVLIIGGGPAGLQSALTLGRVRRKVLLCDDNRGRNAPTSHMQNFPTRDGTSPTEFREEFKKDIRKYKTVKMQTATVLAITKEEKKFVAELSSGEKVLVEKLIFASGIEDIPMPIPGMKEAWGKAIFHCPYCHGHEFRDKTMGILALDDHALHMVAILSNLASNLIVLTHGQNGLSEEKRNILKQKNIPIHDEKIVSIVSDGEELKEVILKGNKHIKMSALQYRPQTKSKSDIPLTLGCKKNEMGLYIVDEMGKSTEENIFIVGDMMEKMQSVLSACFRGMAAGAMVNAEISMDNFLKS